MLYKLKIKQLRILVHTNVKSVLHPLQQVWISGITAAEATIKTRSSKPSIRRDGTSANSAKKVTILKRLSESMRRGVLTKLKRKTKRNRNWSFIQILPTSKLRTLKFQS